MHEPFIYQLVPTLVETMSYIFPEIKTNQDHIQKVIKGEEESFNTTLDNGLKIFEELITKPETQTSKTISGEDAFKLYDTFGFPLDLTELMASEHGLKVDFNAFIKLMEEQKVRSRETRTASINIKIPKQQLSATATYTPPEKTTFLGYSESKLNSIVVANVARWFALRETPFYGESGGQVGDTGFIIADGIQYKVIDTKRDQDIFLHITKDDLPDIKNKIVTAEIDLERRLSIMRNHSATHLLHNALRRILGTHVHQAGSLVAPDYLRFDFAHFAKLTDQELADIESLVNEKIKENLPRTPGLNNIPFEDAKKLGALMFFGDKYGDFVNVIQFGDFSIEFCGGTHVNNTGEIGYFKIRTEGSVASGVRRIEAVTHDYALELLKLQDQNLLNRLEYANHQIDELSKLKTELISTSDGKTELIHNSFGGFEQRLENLKRVTAFPIHASIELASCFHQITRHNRVLEEIILQLADEKKALEKDLAKSRLKSLSGSMDDLIASAVTIGDIKLVASKVSAASIDEVKNLGDSLRSKLGSGVGLLACVLEDKVQLVCVVTDDLVAAKIIEAGKVVGAIAKFVGGGGGGRPHMATAGGKDVSKIDEALAQTKSVVESLLRK
jgi:alanyl-tRNA synthetase